MGLSRLSERCKRCSLVDVCERKMTEGLMYIPSNMEIGLQNTSPTPEQMNIVQIDASFKPSINDDLSKLSELLYASLGIRKGIL